jgi:hypothetical protein
MGKVANRAVHQRGYEDAPDAEIVQCGRAQLNASVVDRVHEIAIPCIG